MAQPKVARPRGVHGARSEEAEREGARLVLGAGTSLLANLLLPTLLFYLQPVLLNQLLAWGLAGLVLLDGTLVLALFALRRQTLALGCGSGAVLGLTALALLLMLRALVWFS